jgi:outer membrane biogenesis lipoprotein LolB
MNNKIKYLLIASLGFFLLLSCGEVAEQNPNNSKSSSSVQNILDAVQESGKYTTKDSVATYISKFKKLPSNYVNKG